MSYSDKRAKELLLKIKNKIARNMTTIAVGLTDSNAIIGTNDRRLHKDVKSAMKQNEIVAKSRENTHAEEDVIYEADRRKQNLNEIGASRYLFRLSGNN